MTDILNYKGTSVRTAMMNGEPAFCAADVCAVLGLTNPTRALATLDDDEKGLTIGKTPSGDQQMLFVNEGGLYALIHKSRKPEAKAFKRWVNHEVLPAIRKTGSYAVPLQIPNDPIVAVLSQALAMRQHQIEQDEKIINLDERLCQIENRQSEIEANTLALPAADAELRELDTREKCRVAIESYVSLTGHLFEDAWKTAYRKYDFQKRTAVTRLAKEKKMTRMDYVCAYGDVNVLYAIILQMVKQARGEAA